MFDDVGSGALLKKGGIELTEVNVTDVVDNCVFVAFLHEV